MNKAQAEELKRLECIVVSCAASRNIETTRKARQKLRSCIDSLVVESFADVERIYAYELEKERERNMQLSDER